MLYKFYSLSPMRIEGKCDRQVALEESTTLAANPCKRRVISLVRYHLYQHFAWPINRLYISLLVRFRYFTTTAYTRPLNCWSLFAALFQFLSFFFSPWIFCLDHLFIIISFVILAFSRFSSSSSFVKEPLAFLAFFCRSFFCHCFSWSKQFIWTRSLPDSAWDFFGLSIL